MPSFRRFLFLFFVCVKLKLANTLSTPTTLKKLSVSVEELERKLSKCKSGTAARKVLSDAFLQPETETKTSISSSMSSSSLSSSSLYKSISIPREASKLTISDAQLAIQTNIRNNKYSIMELIELNGDKDADRASLAIVAIFIGSTLSAITTQNSLPGPEIIRFLLSWIFSFLPFIFVGAGLTIPIQLYSTLVSIQAIVFPSYRKRMVHHEAGHFLIGHLIGLPIQKYQANAIKNAVEFYPLRDEDVGNSLASLLGFDKTKSSSSSSTAAAAMSTADKEEDKAYFGKGGRGEEIVLQQSVYTKSKNYTDNNTFTKKIISNQNDIKQAWPYRGFDHKTIDELAVISVAGICSEILSFGNAEGGYVDIGQLKQILNNAEPELNNKEQENIIRYAIGFTMGILKSHLGALDDLIDVMERGGSVAECIVAIESCENTSGATVMGNYEQIRKNNIQKNGIGFVERILLGGSKNANVQDMSVIEGKGGGGRKEGFQLTGDDPLYAALATAAFFLVYASTGGISLH